MNRFPITIGRPCPGAYLHSGPSATEPSFAAPQPQLAALIRCNTARPLPEFVRLQHRLLQDRRKHRPIFMSGEELTWSRGRLIAFRPQDGRVRELTDNELRDVRRVETAITGYLDGGSALENCEKLLAVLSAKSSVSTPLVGGQRASAAELSEKVKKDIADLSRKLGKGVPKRPIFAEGSFVVAIGNVQGLPDYCVQVLREPGVPLALPTRRMASRWWIAKRRAQYLTPGEEPLVLEVVRRFRIVIDLPPEVSRLRLPDLIHTLKRYPDMVSDGDVAVRYLARYGQEGDDRRRRSRNQADPMELATTLARYGEDLRKVHRLEARCIAVRDLSKRMFQRDLGYKIPVVDHAAHGRAMRLMPPTEATRLGADQMGLFEPYRETDGLHVWATWRGSAPKKGNSLNYRCELVVPDLPEILCLGGREPECWLAFTEGAKKRGGGRPQIYMPVARRTEAIR